jgi:outer membrane immunogenic protein
MKKILSLTLILLLATPGAFAKSKKSSSRKSTVSRSKSSKGTSSTPAKTIDMNQQFDSLGSDEDIMEKARALQPDNSMRVVQKREVDRTWRPEIGLSYGLVNGGDSYIDTRTWGGNLDLHITPRWSLGLRYVDYKNQLTREGKRAFDDFASGASSTQPAVDYPVSSYMAVVNWYPIYGKISWLEMGVSQFDFYLIGGGGQIKTSNKSSPIYTAGAGMGLWWNSRFTTRLELRYQSYKDRAYTTDRGIDGVVAQFGIGFML